MRFSGKSRTVVDGPFAETKELVAGFWLWQVRSMDEAIEWVRRCPNPMPGDSEIEIRPVFEAEDFGEAFTPELRAQEDELRLLQELFGVGIESCGVVEGVLQLRQQAVERCRLSRIARQHQPGEREPPALLRSIGV